MADSLRNIASRAPVNRLAAAQIGRSREADQPKGMLEPPLMYSSADVDRAVANGLKDLRGIQFGQLKPVGIAVTSKQRALEWVCRCTCGRYEQLPRRNLEDGSMKRCQQCEAVAEMRENRYTGEPRDPLPVSRRDTRGVWEFFRSATCPEVRPARPDDPLDISGKKFGRLLCVGQSPSERGGRRSSLLWVCACSCGSFIFRQKGALEFGTASLCTVCAEKEKDLGVYVKPSMMQGNSRRHQNRMAKSSKARKPAAADVCQESYSEPEI